MSLGSTPWVSNALKPSDAPPSSLPDTFPYACIGVHMTILVRGLCYNWLAIAKGWLMNAAHPGTALFSRSLQNKFPSVVQNNCLCQLLQSACISQKRGNHRNAGAPPLLPPSPHVCLTCDTS